MIEQRRAGQWSVLVDLLGSNHRALELLNAVDQIGLEDPVQRCEVIDALIRSIDKGQRWATGESSLEIRTCPVCDGTGRSRSARGRCRVCNGHGRDQVACRECAERVNVNCRECRGLQRLDPVAQRETILKQHRDWWEGVTKMGREEENLEQPILDGAFGGKHAVPQASLTREERDAAELAGGGDYVAGAMREGEPVEIFVRTGDGAFAWMPASFVSFAAVGMVLVRRGGMPATLYERCCMRLPRETHVGPPERPTAQRGVVSREHGAIQMHWDRKLGDDTTGIGTLEKPYSTFAAAEQAAELGVVMHAKIDAASREDCVEVPDPAAVSREIAAALLTAQMAIVDVVKTNENDGDGYAYASAEAIIREARKALHGAGLFVMPLSWKTIVRDGEKRLEVSWTLQSKAGGWLAFPPLSMPIVAEKGRAADKAEAAALTYLQSQFLRELLQIPRVEKSIDVDARVDVGDGGRRRARKEAEDRAPLSTELNDLVVSLHKAIDTAKDTKALDGVLARLNKATDLPEAVAARVREAITKKAEAKS